MDWDRTLNESINRNKNKKKNGKRKIILNFVPKKKEHFLHVKKNQPGKKGAQKCAFLSSFRNNAQQKKNLKKKKSIPTKNNFGNE